MTQRQYRSFRRSRRSRRLLRHSRCNARMSWWTCPLRHKTRACDSEVQKIVKIPQVQYIDKIVDFSLPPSPKTPPSHPSCVRRQLPTIQTKPKTVEVPQSHYLDRVVDVLVVMQRETSMIQNFDVFKETKGKTKNTVQEDTFQSERGPLHYQWHELAQDTLGRE